MTPPEEAERIRKALSRMDAVACAIVLSAGAKPIAGCPDRAMDTGVSRACLTP